MKALRGEYRHKLDTKGRVSMPSAFRKILPEEIVVTIAPGDGYLMVFTSEGYEDWINSLFVEDEGYKPTNPEHRDRRRFISSRTKDVELDASGRINLAPEQREAVGLDKDVVLIGDVDHLEIWDAKRLDEHHAKIDSAAWFNKS